MIAAALSVQDPRERPLERAAAADERTRASPTSARTSSPTSSCGSCSSGKMEQGRARENFLSIPRMREWRDVHAQLRTTAGGARMDVLGVNVERARGLPRDPSRAARRPARQRRHERRGRQQLHRRARHQVLGASGLLGAKKPGRWIMAARAGGDDAPLSRAASPAIDPKWLEELGAHLLKRDRAASRTGRRAAAQVVALERGTLYGLPVYADRRVHFGPIDPQLRARDLHPLGAGRRRLRHARAVLRPQPAPRRRHRAPRAQVAPAGHPGRRRADPRLLRRASCPEVITTARPSRPGARKPSAATRSCSTSGART